MPARLQIVTEYRFSRVSLSFRHHRNAVLQHIPKLSFFLPRLRRAKQIFRPVAPKNQYLSTLPIRELFKGWELKKYFDYVEKRNISDRLYLDYLNACQHLNVDMTLKQNLFPKDFQRWHDIRIAQYAEQKAIEQANKDLELTKKLADVAKKYMPLQHNKRSAYICVIARTPADLIHEGETLHHCVGRMCYDLRMANEESLIFFIRTKTQPEKPFVTLEYSLKTHKVLQCYGIRNSKPNDETLHYVNKIWLPYANKTIKRIAA